MGARKRALRDRVLAARDGLSPPSRQAATRAITSRLTARGDFLSARAVLITLPFGSEWDTRGLIAEARGRNAIVAVPRVNQTTRMLDLFQLVDEARDVVPGFRGIAEPLAHCAPVPFDAIDWVLVPGVAFDPSGRRIGYGGGYYDRLLPMLRPDVARIAGAFELQIVDAVPVAPHDQRLHAIVTERRTLTAE